MLTVGSFFVLYLPGNIAKKHNVTYVISTTVILRPAKQLLPENNLHSKNEQLK